MSKIRSKNTKPELILRSRLHNKGYRFRVHRRDLPGSPDIVLLKYKTVIFIHGCFWHYHENCKEGKIPASNSEFWKRKLEKNLEKDKMNIFLCRQAGWQVIVVWECQLEKFCDEAIEKVEKMLLSAQ